MFAFSPLQFRHYPNRNSSSRKRLQVVARAFGSFRFALLSAVVLSGLAASGQNHIKTVAGGAPSTGTATSSDMAGPAGLVEDANGDLYISSPWEQWIYKLSAGQLSIFAGRGFIGDHNWSGPAKQTPMWNPFQLAIDKKGNIYIADSGDNVVRMVNPAGIQSVIAGVRRPCFGGKCGDGGPAVKANLSNPQGVAVDSIGNVYIADTGDNRVRVINTSGIIEPFAGNYKNPVCSPSTGKCGDGGPAKSANLNTPVGLAVDSQNNVYFADMLDHRIREVSANTISTVAGNGTACFPSKAKCGDGGLAISANLHSPQGVSVDANGNIYIADTADNRIRLVTAATQDINTFAGTGVGGFNGDGSPTSVELAGPQAVYVDKAGNVLIGDSGNQRVREVTAGQLTTIVGGPVPNGGDNGPATSATLADPIAVAIDSANNYYIADRANNRVRYVNVGTKSITTVAGDGNQAYSGDGGSATIATLSSPAGVVVDPSENLYIADTGNHVVRCVARVAGACIGVSGGVAIGSINTVVGTGKPCSPPAGCGDGGPAYSAYLSAPTSVAIDSAGNLFVADAGANEIRCVAAVAGACAGQNGGVGVGEINTVAGTGACGEPSNGGPAWAATLCNPHGIAVDASDDIYIADAGKNRILCVLGAVGGCGDVAHTYGVGDILIYAYDGGETFNQTASASTSTRWNANEVAVDSRGNLFIGGGNDAVVQRVDLATETIVTVAGGYLKYKYYGYTGDGGPATEAHINGQGVAIDSNENLLMGDDGNNRVREVPLVAVGIASPTSINFGDVTVGTSSPPQTVTFTNTGADDMTISGISPTEDFSQTNNCGKVLAPSQLPGLVGCTIQVTFTPTKAGTVNGKLTITHTGYTATTKVLLSGTGD
jgi:trimeric autotransporter adhesin